MKRGILFAGLLLLTGTACRRREAPPLPAGASGMPAIPPASAAAKRYALKGIITAVDPTRFEITVRHEAVPGAMPAATTPFLLRDDPKVVALLRPGDRVEATLVVDGSRRFLEQILTKGFMPTPVSH